MKLFYALALALLLQACGGGDGGAPVNLTSAPASCSVADQRQSLRSFMEQEYFWYGQLRTPDSQAATMDEYFQSMLNTPLDRYSFSQTTASFDQVFTSGQPVGYGYTLAWADEARTTLRVRAVKPRSPVARAGLRRGHTIVSIDGFTAAQIAAGQLPAVTAPGVTRTFVVRQGQSQLEMQVRSDSFDLDPIGTTATFDVDRAGTPVKVGYLAYHQFASYNVGELALTMQRFADQGVGEMILDLRYNGGGSVTVSRDLASFISGSRTDDRVFANLRFNDKQSARNTSLPFLNAQTRNARPVEGLSRLFVITSGQTASASELLINGLRPFMQVVLIGETTFGKPYGSIPRSACGITYNAVQFEASNALGFSNYTAGFSPDCQVPDDLEHQLGDPAEGRLRAALEYVATGSCGVQQAQSLRATGPRGPVPVFGETTPKHMILD